MKKKTDKLLMKKVVICGMGVMGGSLGYSLCRTGLIKCVQGLVRRPETIREIIKLKLAHKATDVPREALKDAELIILAIPPETIGGILKSILPFLKPGMIVTDLCSVKKSVVGQCEMMLKGKASYIGSHPMTGTEKFGFSNYVGDLYKDTPCIITPTPNTPVKALKIIKSFWRTVGSKLLIMDPLEHDISASYISHLPHVIAYSLSNTVCRQRASFPFLFKMAAGSYKDMTRIAGSSPSLWVDIFLNNKKEILKSVKEFRNNLDFLYKQIKESDKDKISDFLNTAYNGRKEFEKLINEK